MTDYLERHGENEDALLELERRLAAALAGAAARAGQEEPVRERTGRAAAVRTEAAPEGGGETEDGDAPAGRSRLLDEVQRTDTARAAEDSGGLPPGAAGEAGDLSPLPAGPETRTGGSGGGETPSPWRDALEAARGRSALLEQLERVERAATLPQELGAELSPSLRSRELGRTGRYASPSPLPGSLPADMGAAGGQVLFQEDTGQVLRLQPGGQEGPPGGGTDWAQQVDRAFRRDSRRYDGGFYLY